MVKITLEKVNSYTTKLVADGKEVLMTDMSAKEKYYGKIKELIITVVLTIIMVLIFTVPLMLSPKEEKYKPEHVDNGILYDVDQDGLLYVIE